MDMLLPLLGFDRQVKNDISSTSAKPSSGESSFYAALLEEYADVPSLPDVPRLPVYRQDFSFNSQNSPVLSNDDSYSPLEIHSPEKIIQITHIPSAEDLEDMLFLLGEDGETALARIIGSLMLLPSEHSNLLREFVAINPHLRDAGQDEQQFDGLPNIAQKIMLSEQKHSENTEKLAKVPLSADTSIFSVEPGNLGEMKESFRLLSTLEEVTLHSAVKSEVAVPSFTGTLKRAEKFILKEIEREFEAIASIKQGQAELSLFINADGEAMGQAAGNSREELLASSKHPKTTFQHLSAFRQGQEPHSDHRQLNTSVIEEEIISVEALKSKFADENIHVRSLTLLIKRATGMHKVATIEQKEPPKRDLSPQESPKNQESRPFSLGNLIGTNVDESTKRVEEEPVEELSLPSKNIFDEIVKEEKEMVRRTFTGHREGNSQAEVQSNGSTATQERAAQYSAFVLRQNEKNESKKLYNSAKNGKEEHFFDEGKDNIGERSDIRPTQQSEHVREKLPSFRDEVEYAEQTVEKSEEATSSTTVEVPVDGFTVTDENNLSNAGLHTFVRPLGESKNIAAPVNSKSLPRLKPVDLPDAAAAIVRSRPKGGVMRLLLNPSDLGNVTLRVAVKDNNVHVRILVETQQAKEALMQRSTALSDTLRSLGLDVEKIDIRTSEQSQGSQERYFAGGERGTSDRQHHTPGKHERTEYLRRMKMLRTLSLSRTDAIA